MNRDSRLTGFRLAARFTLALFFRSNLVTSRLLVLAAYHKGGLLRNPFLLVSAPACIRFWQFIKFPVLSAMIRGVSFLPTISFIGELGDTPDAKNFRTSSVSSRAIAVIRVGWSI